MGRTPDLGQQAEALRELAREANGTIKDLRAAIAEARKTAPAIVGERLDKAVSEGVAALGEKTRQAMDDAVAKVNAEFDKLSDILMGRTAEDKAEGKRSIPELVHEMTREPETVTDPRRLGGNISSRGGPHDKGLEDVDSRDAVLLDQTAVGIAQEREDGGKDAIALVLGGKINRSKDRARVLYLLDADGAAGIVANIEALMRRGAADGWAERYAKAKVAEETRLRADGAWE